jgi:protein-S-isoprenylcysteine O-methyltransferase Ste14
MLDNIRYAVALLTVLTLPFAVLYWYLVHPFVGFWRRLGPAWTYVILTALAILIGYATWQVRGPLLAVEYGTGPPLWVAAAAAYALAIYVEIRCRRHLRLATLAGLPEIRSPEQSGGRLLCEGIYAQIRHPRYVSVSAGMLAAALFCNYLAVWVLAVAVPLALVGVVHFEERELRERFGEAYVEYAERVPRFVPRLRR